MPNLGDPSAAMETYRQGLGLLGSIPEGSGPPRLELARARLFGSLGEVLSLSGAIDDSLKYLRRSEGLLVSALKSAPQDADIAVELASRRESIADRLAGVGTGKALDEAQAIRDYESCRATWRDVASWPGVSPEIRTRATRANAVVLAKLGNLDLARERYSQAIAHHREARTVISTLDRATRESLTSIRTQIMILKGEGYALLWSGKPQEAMTIFAEALALGRQLVARDTQNEQNQSGLMSLLAAFGDAAQALNRPADARAAWREAEQIAVAMLAHDPNNSVAKTRLDDIRAKLAGPVPPSPL
jgi:tetratricopeptide (TPR) repeat protein